MSKRMDPDWIHDGETVIGLDGKVCCDDCADWILPGDAFENPKGGRPVCEECSNE